MDPEMSSMFPNGIRALIVDDDARFLKSATTVLSALNFEVVTCATAISALRLLTGDKNKEIVDVVLAHAEKVAACGFDFRAIVEADLCIPVIYFLSPDHKATGDAADKLLRTLHTATYVMKKPFDVNDVLVRSLWRVIAWHKCRLEAKVSKGAGGNGVAAAAAAAGGTAAALAGSAMDDDEERVHFKIVRGGVRDRKRKRSSSSPGVSSNAGVAAKRQEQLNVAATDQEKDNMAGQQEEQKNPSKRAKNNDGEASTLQQPRAMNNGQQPGQRQPQESLFVQSVLRTLNLPAYNPKICADTAGPSNTNVAAFAGASNTAAAPAPALHPVSYQEPALRPPYSAPATTAPLWPPVNPAPAALPPVRQQQQPPPSTAGDIFGNMIPPAAAVEAMAAATATCEPQFFRDNQQQQGVNLPLMFGPFPYNGPESAVAQQDMVTPADGDLFTGMAGGVTAIGGSAADAGAYGNNASPFLQPPSFGVEQDGDNELAVAVMAAMYPMADPPVAPQGVAGGASNEAAMAGPHDDIFSSYCAGAFFGLDEAFGMPSNANGLTMAGGAFGCNNAASFMAPQDPGVVSLPNGDHQAPGAGDNMIYGTTFMASQSQGPSAAMDGDGGGLSAEMFPSDRYEENTLFPLEALLDLHTPMYDADPDAQHGGSSSGAASVVAAGVAGTSLVGGVVGESGMDYWDVGDAGGLETPDNLFIDSSTGDFLFPRYIMNNGLE